MFIVFGQVPILAGDVQKLEFFPNSTKQINLSETQDLGRFECRWIQIRDQKKYMIFLKGFLLEIALGVPRVLWRKAYNYVFAGTKEFAKH